MRILVVLLILGIAGAAMVASFDASKSSPNGAGGPVTIPSPAKGPSAADIAACNSDYAAGGEAALEYQVQHGTLAMTAAELQPYLRDSLSTAQFTITIAAGHPGQLEVSTPSHPASPGNGNCAYAGE